MNADLPETSPTAPAPPPSNDSPGALIRQAREAAKMSLDELASHTKLARATLDAIERDNYDALLEPVYVRGYYRKCAKVLNIEEPRLLAAYEKRVHPKAPAPPARLRLATGSEGFGGRGWRGMAILVVIVVIAGVAAWYLRQMRPASVLPPVDLPAPTSTPAPSSESGASGSTTGPSAIDVAPASAPLPATTPAADAGTPAAPTSEVSATPESSDPAAAGETKLYLNFVSISWARIEDAEGRVLLNRVVQGGERQTFDGKPPYSVFLGNAPGVEVSYQGKSIDFKHLIRDSATARFTVPLAPN